MQKTSYRRIKSWLIGVLFVLGISINANADVPHIIRFIPPPYSTNIIKSVSLKVAFDEDMNEATINENSFVVYGSQTGWHPGSITYVDSTRTVTYDPDFNFKEGEWVIATLTSNIEDIDGNHIWSYVWNFSIGVAGGAGVFGPDTEYNTCEGPRSVTCADFDNDGNLDLAVGHRFSDSMVVFKNPGNGIFERDSVYATSGSYSAYAPCKNGDLNRDGDIDIVLQMPANNLSVFFNNGDGIFCPEQLYPMSFSGAYRMYINDLNGDGYLDVAVATCDDAFLVFFNDGFGNFYDETNYLLDAGIIPISGGDFDGDGDIDLVTVSMVWPVGAVEVRVFINQGDGSFVEGESYLIGYDMASQCVFCHDFNLDGYVDVAVNRSRGVEEPAYVLIFLNNGDGTFADYVEYEATDLVTYLYGNDIDGDGDVDLMTSMIWIDSLAVFINDGTGCFLSPVYYGVGEAPDGVDGGDLDSDGDIDLVVANQYGGLSGHGSISVLINEGGVEPNIGTSTRLLSFGKVNIGDSLSLSLDVYNLGYDTLTVNNLIIGDSIFTVNEASFTLLPESTKTVTVTFAPVTNDSIEDTLTIFSNDPDGPKWKVILRGNYPLVGIEEREELRIANYELRIYPNPFRETTAITLSGYQAIDASRSSLFALHIYDISGRLIRQFMIHDSRFTSITWDGSDNSGERLPKGIYFCQLKASGFISTKKVILVR